MKRGSVFWLQRSRGKGGTCVLGILRCHGTKPSVVVALSPAPSTSSMLEHIRLPQPCCGVIGQSHFYRCHRGAKRKQTRKIWDTEPPPPPWSRGSRRSLFPGFAKGNAWTAEAPSPVTLMSSLEKKPIPSSIKRRWVPYALLRSRAGLARPAQARRARQRVEAQAALPFTAAQGHVVGVGASCKTCQRLVAASRELHTAHLYCRRRRVHARSHHPSGRRRRIAPSRQGEGQSAAWLPGAH